MSQSQSDVVITPDIQVQINTNYYVNFIAFSLLYYDFFLTLPWEVARYWESGPRAAFGTVPNVLFFANRYGMLLGNVPVAFMYFWATEGTERKLQICDDLNSFHQYFVVIAQIVVGVMMIFRTYALYERSRRVLVFMVVVSLAVIAVGAWSVFSGGSNNGSTDDAPAIPLYIGCATGIDSSQSIKLAIAWVGMGVFDSMIFILTLARGLSRFWDRGRRDLDDRPARMSLVMILLRDGTVYFAVIILCTLANILTFIYGQAYTRGVATTFTNVLSSIMITRLMLNLRNPALMHTSRSRTLGATDASLPTTMTLTYAGSDPYYTQNELDGVGHGDYAYAEGHPYSAGAGSAYAMTHVKTDSNASTGKLVRKSRRSESESQSRVDPSRPPVMETELEPELERTAER
uniref:DUF6533 domain-containing protein n=1 Tax=Mycena chlorophos TaxID=658473 RepID=A0ABQ0LLI1_MYCCL|nr:predicted protein [Mycena chlorophos]